VLVFIAAVMVVIAVVAARERASQDSRAAFDAAPVGSSAAPQPIQGSQPNGPGGFRDIAKAEMPAVVNIRTESRRQTRDLSGSFGNDLLERFFGAPQLPSGPTEQVMKSAGTGFLIDKSGLILTNNHVVAGAGKISVALYAQEDGAEYDARIVGRDPLTDSALIELTEKPSQELPVATLGQSRDMQPGDWVMAIGNPFNLAHTVTVGVISAVGRPFPIAEGRWQDVLQTDAAINPGNSGGPLLNMRGEVIGINSAILAGGPGAGNVGVGFAIPIDPVRELLPQLRQGTITRGRLGVQVTPVTADMTKALGLQDTRGALVRVVERGGPAASAGIQPGDVIVRYNGTDITKSNELVDMVSRTKPGTSVPLEVIRNGQRQTIRVTVGTLDLDEPGQGQGERQGGGAPSATGFGMALQDLNPQLRDRLGLPPDRGGAVVATVDPSGAAARGGLRAGDIILEVNRGVVSNVTETAAALRRVPEHGTAFVLVWRDGQQVFLTITR
jgi:serine protease Do